MAARYSRAAPARSPLWNRMLPAALCFASSPTQAASMHAARARVRMCDGVTSAHPIVNTATGTGALWGDPADGVVAGIGDVEGAVGGGGEGHRGGEAGAGAVAVG